VDIKSRSAAWIARMRGEHSLQASRPWPVVRGVLDRPVRALSLREQPVARRLAAVALVPTLVAASFGLLRVRDAREAEHPLAEAQRYAMISQAAVDAVEALEDERDAAAPGVAGENDRRAVSDAYASSDRLLTTVLTAVTHVRDAALSFARDDLRTRLASLDELRRTAFSDSLPALATVNRYGDLIVHIIELGRRADSQAVLLAGDPAVAGRTLGVYDLLLAAGLNSQRRAVGTAVLARGAAESGEQTLLGGFGLLVNVQTASFRSVAGPGTAALFEAAGVASAAADVEVFAQHLAAASDDETTADLSARQWTDVTTRYLTKARQVVHGAVDGAVEDITLLRADRTDTTRTDLAVVIAVLLGAALFAGLVGGGLTVELHRMRERVRDVGERRLPLLVATLTQTPEEGKLPSRAGPARTGPDEIGEVVLAFEDVYRQAVRLAATLAKQRATTAGIARTLTRRSQELVGRQLALITELEAREPDPVKLKRLFGLDHLATRIRRHGDSLLVLTGGPAAWRWPRPAALVEVVQAAAATTEQYRRVEIDPLPETGVRAAAIVDLLQILAELIDNATRFSSPDTPVRVTAAPLAGQWMRIEVRDHGYGLGERAAAQLNDRLNHARPGWIGDEPELGLRVVGILAARSGIAVHLQPIDRGCVASVVVPPRLLVPGAAAIGPETRGLVDSSAVLDPRVTQVASRGS
jgi:signal transduction histidine kinase